MKLYTTLVRAKQDLNGGRLPPMTPVPENVRHFIDPAFTPGLGALEEDPEKGLRCPVRGCGKYFGLLTFHLDRAHHDIGGSGAIRAALSIPDNAGLTCQRTHSLMRASCLRRRAGGYLEGRRYGPDSVELKAKKVRRLKKAMRTVGWRNLQNTCEAQILNRLIDARNHLGRVPGYEEVRVIDPGLDKAATKLYGTWNAALSAAGLALNRHGPWTEASVLDSLYAYTQANKGRLPSAKAVKRRTCLPVVPCYDSIRANLGARDWPHAMEIAATALSLPERGFGVGTCLECGGRFRALTSMHVTCGVGCRKSRGLRLERLRKATV